MKPPALVALAGLSVALVLWGSPPLALGAGLLFALAAGRPLGEWSRPLTRWLLQGSVVLLGFGMDLPTVLRLGRDGAAFAAVSIVGTLLLGRWLAPRLGLEGRTATLISVGTAICGGSAIAAASSVMAATQSEIAIALGTVFLLNGAALYLFPLIGHLLGLSQAQFGLWAGVAIHDISSVVGAGLSYGPQALATATAVKLSRTLWIIPVTLAIALQRSRFSAPAGAQPPARNIAKTVPWFIGLFLFASLLRSGVPVVAAWSPALTAIGRRGTVLVLFLMGTSLSMRALRAVGGRTALTGLALWIFVSAGTLLAIRCLPSLT